MKDPYPIPLEPQNCSAGSWTRTGIIGCLGILTGAVLMLSGSPVSAQSQPEAPAAPVDQWTLAFAPEYYYWQENVNGAKVLDETGFRYGLDLAYKQAQEKGWLWAARFKVYYGSVDYNGQTIGGTPVKTTTDYYGGLAEMGYGYRQSLNEEQYLDLMGGLGFEAWTRTLNGSGGYTENWLPIFLKAGLEISPIKTGWIGTLGIKLPVYTVQTVDLSGFGLGTVTLHPATRPSGYAEAGYKFTGHMSLVAYFDSYWFGQSPTVNTSAGQVFQPESISYQVGLKFGWTF